MIRESHASRRAPRAASRTLNRDRRAWAGLSGLVLLALFCTLGATLAGDPTAQDAPARLLPPSWHHPFGTDELRRDLLARTATGLRTSLSASLLSVPAGALFGTLLGLAVGYARGWANRIVMRLLDAWFAFPGVLAAFAIVAVLGPGMLSIGVALALFSFPVFARVARAQTMAERNREYVLAARSTGAGPARILTRHILPNSLAPLVTQFAITFTASILIAAALSFLGLGERPPAPSLGGLLNASRPHIRDAWWYVTFPGAVLATLLLSLNLLSDAVADHLARLR